jgi:hypothetical protein
MGERIKNFKKSVKGSAGGLISALIFFSKGTKETKMPPKKKIKKLKKGDFVSGHQVRKVYYDANTKPIGFTCSTCHHDNNHIHPFYKESGMYEIFRTTQLPSGKK